MKNIAFIILTTLVLSINAQIGALDTSFGDNGKVITNINNNEKAYALVIQGDGKLLIAGYTGSPVYGQDFICIRYNSDGTLDTSFGNNGIVETDIQTGSDDQAKSIALQTDGKIILAGYSDDGVERKAAMVRYNVDGSLDTTFGNNGIVLTSFENGQQDQINVVKIHLLTGKIIVGGESIIDTTKSKPVLARYNADGSLDTGFDTDGIRLLWVTTNDHQYKFSIEDLHVKSNGKITAIGWRDFPAQSWSSNYWLCKVNNDGTMDTTFSSDGVASYNGSFNGHDRAYSLLVKSNDNIIGAGGAYVDNANYDFTIFEISPTGSVVSPGTHLDFEVVPVAKNIAYGLAEDSNGKYILAGSSGNNANKAIALTRINPDLTIDNTFGTSGKVVTTFNGNALNEAFDVKVQNDGKILIAGYTGNNIVVARYTVVNYSSIDEESLRSYSISPNPASDFITLNTTKEIHSLSIYNSLGQVVKDIKLVNNMIDISDLLSGVYYIRVNNASNFLKLIKK